MKSQKTNWWLDAVLYIGFLFTFFLNVTGVELHQWLGIIIGFLALVHLVLHIDWVLTVVEKFFGKLPNSARINLLLDAGIGLGFLAIVFTGVVMSTWLNLTFIDYSAWKTIHTMFSISTLFALLLKLVLHRKWIVRTAGKCFLVEKRKPAVEPVLARQDLTKVNRREFLKVGAAVGAGAIIGVTQLHKVVEDLITMQTGPDTDLVDNNNLTVENIIPTQQEQQMIPVVDQQSTATLVPQATAVPIEQPTVAPTLVAVNSQAATSCQVRCSRGCSFPGRCRKYTDSNGNGKCDYGECL